MLLATCRPPGTAIIGQQQVHARPGEHFRDAEADPGYCASSKGGLSIQIQQVSLKSLSRHRCNQMMCPVPRNCRRRAEFDCALGGCSGQRFNPGCCPYRWARKARAAHSEAGNPDTRQGPEIMLLHARPVATLG